ASVAHVQQSLGVMSLVITDAEAKRNELVLSRVEELGGSYVWEPEVFAVSLLDVAVGDANAKPLEELVGVGQIAIDATDIELGTLIEIAAVPGLTSLVIKDGSVAEEGLSKLEAMYPALDVQTV
ncbi:MAG: hypothetical protein AAFZ58_01575, partial [Pseudomonadota bacterium]